MSCGPTYGPCAVDGVRDGDEPSCVARGAGQRSTASTSSRGWSTTSIPAGVRVADADRVRLGAHLAAGTTVMHEGFVNYNAGTLGASMVEGRISAGVVVGDGTDIGGGASIMGTLSGGGNEVISVGRRCLLGANSGSGHIARRRLCRRGRPLHHGRHQGARCPTVEAIKAQDLSGGSNLSVPS